MNVFNKKGNKLNEEEVKEAIRILKEEEKNGEKTLARIYSDLFKDAKAKIEQRKLISNENIIKELYYRFGNLGNVEKELDIDIPSTMLKHYDDPTKYRYVPKNLFLIVLNQAFESWSEKRKIETVNLEKNDSILKINADYDIYVDALVRMLFTASYEIKRIRFMTNPEEFINEELYNIPIERSIKDSADIISRNVYEGLREMDPSKGLPPTDIIKNILPTFPQDLIELILKLKWSNYKLSVIALASFYNAIIDKVSTFGNSDKVSEISKEIERIRDKNEVTKDDINISKRFLDDLLGMLKQQQLKQAKREGKERERATLQM